MSRKPPASPVNLISGLLGWLFGFIAAGLAIWGANMATTERTRCAIYGDCASTHVVLYVCAGIAGALALIGLVVSFVTNYTDARS